MELLRRRQAQWAQFHQWECSRPVVPISVEERVAWYVAAYTLGRSRLLQEGFRERVNHIQGIRARLSLLRTSLRG